MKGVSLCALQCTIHINSNLYVCDRTAEALQPTNCTLDSCRDLGIQFLEEEGPQNTDARVLAHSTHAFGIVSARRGDRVENNSAVLHAARDRTSVVERRRARNNAFGADQIIGRLQTNGPAEGS